MLFTVFGPAGIDGQRGDHPRADLLRRSGARSGEAARPADLREPTPTCVSVASLFGDAGMRAQALAALALNTLGFGGYAT